VRFGSASRAHSAKAVAPKLEERRRTVGGLPPLLYQAGLAGEF
jgi:hypothetical protein